MRRIVFLAAVLAGLGTAARGETNYECIVDLVTGFHHDSATDSWNATGFLPGERFSIVEIEQDVYRAERIDEHLQWSATCLRRTGQSDDSFACRQGTTELHFNRKELRFVSFRYFGFWNGSNDSLSIAIGNCAAR